MSSGSSFDDINLGLNLGLRVNLSHHHGLEIYSRFNNNGLLQKEKQEIGEAVTTNRYETPSFGQRRTETIATPTNRYSDTFSQPYQIGIRYIYSF